MVKKVLNITFWVVFTIVFAIWVIDFLMVRTENRPIFCLNRETITIEGGTAEVCNGLGYKVVHYNSETIGVGYEFGPFWLQVRGLEDSE